MTGFDFTFDCPIYVLGSENGGYLLTDDRALCLWTDADAASKFIDCSREKLPYISSCLLVEIETEDDLLDLMTKAYRDGILEVAINVKSVFQKIVLMVYVADLIAMLREHLAETVDRMSQLSSALTC